MSPFLLYFAEGGSLNLTGLDFQSSLFSLGSKAVVRRELIIEKQSHSVNLCLCVFLFEGILHLWAWGG